MIDHPARPSMRHGTPVVFGMIGVFFAYVVALFWADSERRIFDQIPQILPLLLLLFTTSFTAYCLRALRWRLLLASRGYVLPYDKIIVGYLTGFAFTASPGKVGELIRVRYFAMMGVEPHFSVAAFIFERLLDLVALLILALLIAGSAPGLGIAIGFVMLVFSAILAVAVVRRPRRIVQFMLRRYSHRSIARWVRILFCGIAMAGKYVAVPILVRVVPLTLGAWLIQCLGFALAMRGLGITIDLTKLISLSAAAMLIGAASFVPGGLGTTEAATTLLLNGYGVPLSTAVLAAITLRLGSIWFAIFLGIIAISILERRVTPKSV